jgi:hypothetical protein
MISWPPSCSNSHADSRAARSGSQILGGLSIIVPVCNESENFAAFIREVERHVPPPFVMNVVYDFDGDTTLPIAKAMAKTRPWLRLIRNELGPGVVNAIKTGFEVVKQGPALVLMADLSDDLRVVPHLLDLYRQGFRVVCPSRYMKGGRQIGGPFIKRTLSRCAGLSLRYLIGFPTHDATNNFRLYDAELVRAWGIESRRGFELALELTAKAFACRIPVAEVPATWRDRTAGSSRFLLRKWLPSYLYWYSYAIRAAFRR